MTAEKPDKKKTRRIGQREEIERTLQRVASETEAQSVEQNRRKEGAEEDAQEGKREEVIIHRLITRSEREMLDAQCVVCGSVRQVPAYYLKIGWGKACSKKCGRALDPAKYRARKAVERAVRSGKLVKQPCELCGNEPTQAHHDDHAQPLDVRWLCVPHHQAISHRELDRLLLASGVQLTHAVEALPTYEKYYVAAKAAYERSYQYLLGIPQGQKIPDSVAKTAKKGSVK